MKGKRMTKAGFDPSDIFAALNLARVEYLTIGGMAVILYGVYRTTWDVDLAVHLTTPNIDRLTKALKRIGFVPRVPAPPSGLADERVRRGWIRNKHMKVYSFITNQAPPRVVDVMVQPPRNFAELYQQRTVVRLGRVPVPLIPLKTLVQLKRAAGRPQDLQDINDLRLLGLK